MTGGVAVGLGDLAALGAAAARLSGCAEDLADFQERSPDLAAAAGVEVAAVEARSILRGGAPARVMRAAMGGREASVSRDDLRDIARLESVVAMSGARIGAAMAAMDAAKNRSGMDEVGSWIGLATGAVGLVRSIF